MIQLQVENTSTCNAKCNFCVYPTAERWGGRMAMSLYRKILDQAGEIDAISQVCITGLGEPTLDVDLVDRIAYARLKKPEAFIDMFTNGVHLTPLRFKQLQEAGLSQLNVSLNAVRSEQHEQIMGLRDKFDLVCSNLDAAISGSTKTQVEVRAVIDGSNFTREDGLRFYQRWGHRSQGGHGQIIMEGNWAGDNQTSRPFNPEEACGRALSQIYVTWDGKVTTCCFDPTGKRVFGDLSLQTIREVYNSEPYVAFRELHSNNQVTKDQMCSGCTRI